MLVNDPIQYISWVEASAGPLPFKEHEYLENTAMRLHEAKYDTRTVLTLFKNPACVGLHVNGCLIRRTGTPEVY